MRPFALARAIAATLGLSMVLAWPGLASAAPLSAKPQTGPNKRILYVEFTDAAIPSVERTFAPGGRAGAPRTGLASFDGLLAAGGAVHMERVFRNGGKFEPRHRKAGLHKWYRIDFARDVDIAPFSRDASVSKVQYGNFFVLNAVPNDPQYPQQPNYQQIGLEQAWNTQWGSPSVIVSDHDTGIDLTHQDLVQNIWINTHEIPNNNIDDDSNGFVDDVHGWNFVANTNNVSDADGHGTHTAGTISAVTNNSTGVAGVAGGPGSGGARIMPLLIIGQIGDQAIAESFVYAADMGARVSNNSWSCSGCQQSVIDTGMNYFESQADGLIVIAAGNDNSGTSGPPTGHATALKVAATSQFLKKSDFSNYGSWVNVAAPGGNGMSGQGCYSGQTILSTFPGNTYGPDCGTSMAAPHVSGLGALLLSQQSSLTSQDLRDIITGTRDGFGPGGQVNAKNAMGVLTNLQQYYFAQHYPWKIQRLTATGMSVNSTLSNALYTFLSGYAGGQLASGNYLVNRKEMRATVTLSGAYQGTLFAFGIQGSSVGWSAANPNNQTAFCDVIGTGSGQVTVHAYVYEVYNIAGQFIGNYPTSAQNASCAFGVVMLKDSCQPPATGDWHVVSDCVVYNLRTAPANVFVENNATVTVTPTGHLAIDFKHAALHVIHGAKVKVQPGGRLG